MNKTGLTIANNQLPLVTVEQAKKLQQLGFDWRTKYHYFSNMENPRNEDFEIHAKPTGYDVDWNDKNGYGLKDVNGWSNISAPTVTLALKWFRDTWKFISWVKPSIDENGVYYHWDENNEGEDTYEGAESASLNYALDNLLTLKKLK